MNPVLLQLLISLGEVALMVGLCLLLFGRASTPGTQAFDARLAQDVPGLRAGRRAVSGDGRSVLVEDARDGAIYLVVARGDGVVTRKLSRSTRVSRDGERLTLGLQDFTLKRAELTLTDASDWEARLKGHAA
ncbi:MAG TPA: hypothetical protein VFV07_01910 [Rhizomicrobium sp.]|nr:hypothetical protein [Rhizomicrobium sp.]